MNKKLIIFGGVLLFIFLMLFLPTILFETLTVPDLISFFNVFKSPSLFLDSFFGFLQFSKLNKLLFILSVFFSLIFIFTLIFELNSKQKQSNRINLLFFLPILIGIIWMIFFVIKFSGKIGEEIAMPFVIFFYALRILFFAGGILFGFTKSIQIYIRKRKEQQEIISKRLKIINLILGLLVLIELILIISGFFIITDKEAIKDFQATKYDKTTADKLLVTCQDLAERNANADVVRKCYRGYGELTGNPEYCDFFTCIEKVAIVAKNPDYCLEYSEIFGEEQQHRIPICIYNAAIESDDVKQCEKIDNLQKRGECIAIVSTNIEMCITGNYTSNCFIKIAEKTGDASLCLMSGSCVESVARITKDVTKCYVFVPEEERYKFDSYQDYPELSSEINNVDNCIWGVASFLKNPSLCEYMVMKNGYAYKACLNITRYE